MSNIWRIPAGIGFADALAQGLLERAGGNPLQLAEMLVLLPTRRACRTLQQAFLRQSDGKALILPRLMPLGDLDADELMLSAGIDIPAAIEARQRQLLLARIIEAQQPGLPTPQYLLLANAFARLLDDTALEAADLNRLETLVADEKLATHWQTTLRFINPLRSAWQAKLKQLGLCDIAARRIALLEAQAKAWAQSPLQTPVILAGSTGALPSIITLMKAILTLPQGEIVLPALPDAEETQGWWDKLDDTHPLCELHNLLGKLETNIESVKLWPTLADHTNHLLHHALRPVATSDLWAKIPPQKTQTLHKLECANEQEEATVIALIMRETLDVKNRTAMLVTPDRNLSRRVASALQRWGVQVDDSAGTPLHKTESAVFLRLVLRAARAPADGLALLSLLKHPMLAVGQSMGAARGHAQLIELEALRQRPPLIQLNDIAAKLPEIAPWLNQIAEHLAPLTQLAADKPALLDTWLRALVFAGEQLSTTDAQDGKERLWRGESGRTLSDWATELLACDLTGITLNARECEDYILALQADAVVRVRYGEHPRLTILGPVEARLQQADRIILSGLNEGIWPAPPSADPWLSRPMRKDMGLKSPEARLGQEAHDFYSHAAGPDVYLTRAIRQGGTPTLPARWLRRLDIVLANSYAKCSADYVAIARKMDTPDRVQPALPPAPTPPRSARPKIFSVTQIEKWLQDPYTIYARKVLYLYKLQPLAQAPGAAERGDFYHAVLHKFVKSYQQVIPQNARAILLQLGETELAARGLGSQRTLWWPRFERLVDWFIEHEIEHRAEYVPLETETNGELQLADGFTLTARADRIDKRSDGTLAIIDYKSGRLPSAGERNAGYSVQLPLEGAIAQAGGFKEIPKADIGELTFWHLTGAHTPGEIEPFRSKIAVQQSINDALAQLRALIAEFDNDTMPYYSEPNAAFPPQFSDYRHLARWKEWSQLDEVDE